MNVILYMYIFLLVVSTVVQYAEKLHVASEKLYLIWNKQCMLIHVKITGWKLGLGDGYKIVNVFGQP